MHDVKSSDAPFISQFVSQIANRFHCGRNDKLAVKSVSLVVEHTTGSAADAAN